MPHFANPLASSLLGRLLSGAFVAYGMGAVFALLSQILLARFLGSVEYGIYYYVLSWLVILVVIARLGVDHAVLRFLPAYLASNLWGNAGGGSNGDPLYQFKAGFSKLRGRFSTWRLVCDSQLYDQAIAEWQRKAGRPVDARDGYFPPYRQLP